MRYRHRSLSSRIKNAPYSRIEAMRSWNCIAQVCNPLAAVVLFRLHVRNGDKVMVHEISRLARNTADLLSLVKQMTDKGVTIVFKKEGLTFTGDKSNAMNQMLLTMLGAVSEFELAMINERRAKGQAKARAEGKHMGRSAKLSPEQGAAVRERAAAGESKTDLAAEYGVSRATLYAVLKVA